LVSPHLADLLEERPASFVPISPALSAQELRDELIRRGVADDLIQRAKQKELSFSSRLTGCRTCLPLSPVEHPMPLRSNTKQAAFQKFPQKCFWRGYASQRNSVQTYAPISATGERAGTRYRAHSLQTYASNRANLW